MLQLDRASSGRTPSSFVSSLGIHAVVAAVLWHLPGAQDRATPMERARAEAREATSVRLVSPPPVVWRGPNAPRPPRRPTEPQTPPPPRQRFAAPAVQRTATPQPQTTPLQAPAVKVAVESRAPEITWESKPVALAAPQVREAGFGAAPARTPRLASPRRRVHAGGFGSVEQHTGHREGQSEVNLAGFGKSARGGGQRPHPGAIATTAGFGAARAGESTPSSGPAVQSGGFGTIERGPLKAPKTVAQQTETETPLRIDSKPKPRYSDEARTQGVEGDVRLRVRFLASGAAEVIEVVTGLGFGLDEAAADAARGIRFRPAERDGRPVDTVAIIRITFQTAS